MLYTVDKPYLRTVSKIRIFKPKHQYVTIRIFQLKTLKIKDIPKFYRLNDTNSF